MNPEFRRNLLLELTLHRLVAMPLILLLIYAAAGLGSYDRLVSDLAWYAMMVLLVLWGTRLAADAVLGEVTARTWDSQRMSAIGPFAMSWSKLLGSTVYVWYGAILSIPAFLYAANDFRDLLAVLATGLMAQAVALIVSLLVQRQRPERLRFQVTASQLFGVGAGIAYWSVLSDGILWFRRYDDVHWYGLTAGYSDFMQLSGLAFLAWACFGIYRLMRAELQFRSWPVGWTCFVLFCAVYVGGFSPPEFQLRHVTDGDRTGVETLLRLLAAFTVVVGLVWAGAYAEPKGFVRLRRWGDALRLRDPRHFLETTPGWLPGILAALVLCLVTLAVWSLSADVRYAMNSVAGMGSLGAFATALVLFLLRDIGVIYFLTLDARKRRAHLTALVYLVVLYVLFPVVLAAADWEDVLPAFLPHAKGDPLVILLPVLVQVGIVGALLALRWQKVARSMADG